MLNHREISWKYDFYKYSLTEILNMGFKVGGFRNYLDTEKNPKKFMILRHDIDFDLDSALRFALFEHQNNIQSSYFFRVSAKGYNLMSAQGLQTLQKVRQYGHEIGLHLDLNISKLYAGDEVDSCVRQCDAFANILGTSSFGISVHMPGSTQDFEIVDQVIKLRSLMYHSYENRFISQPFKYVSDSMMLWREKPLTELAKSFDKLQVLTHPIWWYEDVSQFNF